MRQAASIDAAALYIDSKFSEPAEPLNEHNERDKRNANTAPAYAGRRSQPVREDNTRMTDDTLGASLAGPANVAGTDTGRRCQAGRILDTTTPANRAAILHMLHSRREDGDQYVTDQELARRLRDGGRPCSASLLSYHRTRLCVCDTFAPDESETA